MDVAKLLKSVQEWLRSCGFCDFWRPCLPGQNFTDLSHFQFSRYEAHTEASSGLYAKAELVEIPKYNK